MEEHPWAETREKGKWRFILIRAMVFSVGFVALNLLFATIDWTLPEALLTFPTGGVFYGWAMWTWSEYDYRKWSKRMNNDLQEESEA